MTYFRSLLSALMRFSMAIHVSEEELKSVTATERNCSKHISVVNDIYSWEKELIASKTLHQEGAVVCSAVQIVADEANLSIEASKRALWAFVREWELVHDELRTKREASPEGCSDAMKAYMKGLEYQMSGNKLWSQTTLRYIGVTEL